MSDIYETNENSVQVENRRVRRSDGSHGNYHSALLLVFLLGTLGVALAFAPVLVLPSFNPSALAIYVTNFTTILGAVFALLVATTSLCLIIGKGRLVTKGYVQFSIGNQASPPADNLVINNNLLPHANPTSSRVYKNVHRSQIVFFGTGSALYMIIGLVKVVLNPVTFVEEIADTTDFIIKFISLVTQITFFIIYECALFQNVALLHYAIAVMIADKIWVWVSLTFVSVAEIVNQQSPIEPGIDPSNSSSLSQKVLETSQSFLEPFFIEFLTTCVGILLGIWSSMVKKKQSRTLSNPEFSGDIYSPSRGYGSTVSTESQEGRPLVHNDYTESAHNLLSSRENSEQDTSVTSFPSRTNRAASLVFVVAGISYLIAGLFLRDGLAYITNSVSSPDRMAIFVGIQIALFWPLTILCIISAYKMYNNVSQSPASLAPNDYLLLVATAGVFLWLLFKLIAAIAVLSHKHNELKVTNSDALISMIVFVMTMMQVWIQAQFLLGAHSVHGASRDPLSKLTQVCLIYLGAINASEWLQLGLERQILIHRHSTLTPLLYAVYGDIGTRILVFVLYPMMELYRFHSVVMAFEIWT